MMNKISETSAQIKRNEQEHDRVWNAAIEAAAKCVEQANRDGPYQAIASHREIRKLKK